MDFRYFIFEYGGGFIRDSVNDKILGFEGICDCLNEQQRMIDDLKEENEKLKNKLNEEYIKEHSIK